MSSSSAIKMTTHAPSPSYVPRNTSLIPGPASLPPRPQVGPAHSRSASTSRIEVKPSASASNYGGSRPSSPAMGTNTSGTPGPSYTPRLAQIERSGSSLKNEFKADVDQGAKAILKLFSSLPAPLPETLPPTFLPTPSASPSSSTSSPPRTFADFVRASSASAKRKRLSSNSDSDNSSDSQMHTPAAAGVGLGLGLNINLSPEARKRQRLDSSPHLPYKPELPRSISAVGSSTAARSLTPSQGAPGVISPQLAPAKKELGKSALRNEVTDEREEGKESWSRQRWRDAAEKYKKRALLLKRHGDAYQRAPAAHQQFVSSVPHDPIKGLLCLTDSVLLWLYAYFCDERGSGRVRGGPYNESAPLRGFVLRLWETEMRNGEDEAHRQMSRAMVGLMYLIEAVIGYHLSAEQLSHLSKRGRELSSTSTPIIHGPSPGSTTSNSPPNTAGLPSASSSSGVHQTQLQQPQPSPIAIGRSDSQSSSSPDSHTSSTALYNLPPDLLPLISTSTSSSLKAAQQLLTSRHHLSLSLLRTMFPKTFEYAINSELSDEALPAPGDHLGSARRIDIDHHPQKFAWPIELGMCAPIAHTVAFGRCLIEEMAENEGREWNRVLQ